MSAPLRVACVSGIFPPDVGGPATHAATFARVMRERGLPVTVLSFTDEARRVEDRDLVRFPRRWPWPLRVIAVALWILIHRRAIDVIYAPDAHVSAALGGILARRPLVAKVVGDLTWERARRLGLTEADIDAFQDEAASWRVRLMRALWRWGLRRASAITTPSAYLRGVVSGWVGAETSVIVIPNGVDVPESIIADTGPSTDHTLRTIAVGRLIPEKHVDRTLAAVADLDDVSLQIIGEGPERDRLTRDARDTDARDRIELLGALTNEEVLRRLAAADVLVLGSEYEGLPHVAIEALACGTPVVATDAGGTSEAVTDGVDGVLVEARSDAIADALRGLRDDAALRASLTAGAIAAGKRWRFDRCADSLVAVLDRVTHQLESTQLRDLPRIINVGRAPLSTQMSVTDAHKLELLSERFDATLIARGRTGARAVAGVNTVCLPDLRPRALGGALFYAVAPLLVLVLAMRRRVDAVICQSPFEAFGVGTAMTILSRSTRPLLVVEVHGDWHVATRLVGSRIRRLVSPAADAAARAAFRRADRVRVVSAPMAELVREAGYDGEIVEYPAYSDYRLFLETEPEPLPARPSVVCVATLERVKGVDVLVAAWPGVNRLAPGATLTIVGDGPARGEIERQIDELGIRASVDLAGRVDRVGVKELLDSASLLVLSSRSEGLGLALIEAMARGRPVVASDVGGASVWVRSTRAGILVPPRDPSALADAIVTLLRDTDRAAALGDAGRAAVEARDPDVEYSRALDDLAAWSEAAATRADRRVD